MHHINNIRKVDFFYKYTLNSPLFVYERDNGFPLTSISRVFIVKAEEATKRGNHAHKECIQLLVAINGKCKVICDDGADRKEFILENPSQGLLIPSTIWAEQVYEKDSILMVLADQLYDETDYIRDYKDFLSFRGIV